MFLPQSSTLVMHGRGKGTPLPNIDNPIHVTINGGNHLNLKRFPVGFASGPAYERAFDMVGPVGSFKHGHLFRLEPHTRRLGMSVPICGKFIKYINKHADWYKYCLDRCDSPLSGLLALSWALHETSVPIVLLGYSFDYKHPGAHNMASNKKLLKTMKEEFPERVIAE